MIAQLSISRAVSQPELRNLRQLIAVFALFVTSLTAPTVLSSELELQIRPLSAIDKHYMAEQRQTVEKSCQSSWTTPVRGCREGS